MKFRKYITMYLIIILSLSLEGCSILRIVQNSNIDKKASNLSHPPKQNRSSEVNTITSKRMTSTSDQLPVEAAVKNESDLINILGNNLALAKDTKVIISNPALNNIIVDIAVKAAEQYGFSGYISNVEYSLSNNTALIHYDYKGGSETFLSNYYEVQNKVKSIISGLIRPGMSDFEKELLLHDYVVNNVVYDYQNVNRNTVPDSSYTAFGALIKGTAVCEGYAEAIYRLLNDAGVETMIVTGTGNNIPHAWNIVKISDSYYHLDATFDDPISSEGNILSYAYFNVTNTQISKDHVWDKEKYPICSSDSANYFVRNHLLANNKTDFYNIVKEGLLRKKNIIMCRTAVYDPNTFKADIVSEIINNNPPLYRKMNLQNGFTYDYNQITNVFEFNIKYK